MLFPGMTRSPGVKPRRQRRLPAHARLAVIHGVFHEHVVQSPHGVLPRYGERPHTHSRTWLSSVKLGKDARPRELKQPRVSPAGSPTHLPRRRSARLPCVRRPPHGMAPMCFVPSAVDWLPCAPRGPAPAAGRSALRPCRWVGTRRGYHLTGARQRPSLLRIMEVSPRALPVLLHWRMIGSPPPELLRLRPSKVRGIPLLALCTSPLVETKGRLGGHELVDFTSDRKSVV